MTPGMESIIRCMKRDGTDLTRENYIAYAWAGQDLAAWTFEDENELPEGLQDWSLFEQRGDNLVYVGPDIET
jgi:hypothetical protein